MTILVPGDTFEIWFGDPLGRHNICKVIVSEPGSEPKGDLLTPVGIDGAKNDLAEYHLMYLPPDRAQAIIDMVRGGGSAEDDEP